MGLGDGANDGRAQPGSAMTRGARLGATRERIERSLGKLRRQSGTFILDRMMAEPARLQSRDFYTDRRRVVLSIIEKGEQCLANTNPVAENDQILRRELEREAGFASECSSRSATL